MNADKQHIEPIAETSLTSEVLGEQTVLVAFSTPKRSITKRTYYE
jgi:hypothetical protein